MDANTLLPIIAPAIQAAIVYLQMEDAKKISDKAAESIGEKTGEGIAKIGAQALNSIRSFSYKKGDKEAADALTILENYPHKEAYRHQFAQETARMASTDAAFAQELKVLSEEAAVNNIGDTSQIINNFQSNYGQQGMFFGQASNRDKS